MSTPELVIPARPRILCEPPDPDKVPAAMREARQWITWVGEWSESENKWKKPPTDHRTGRKCDPTDPANWTTFDEARAAALKHEQGVGFSFGNGWVGVDIDKTGWAQAKPIVDALNSYTERSPSGDGFHLYFKDSALPSAVKVKYPEKYPVVTEIEMYAEKRFFTVTGDHVEGTPTVVSDSSQSALDRLYGNLKPSNSDKESASGRRTKFAAVKLSADELSHAIRKSKDAEKFFALYRDGDTSAYANDTSRAVMGLLARLAFWTDGDAEWMDELFRESALHKLPEQAKKWSRLGAEQIAKTLEGFEIGYCPGGFVKTVADDGPHFHRFNETAPTEAAKSEWRRDAFKPLRERGIEAASFVVEGFLAERAINLLVGDFGSGKSIITMSVCDKVSRGQEWAGRETKRRPAMIFDRENSPGYVLDIFNLLGIKDGDQFTINLGSDEVKPPPPTDAGLMAWVKECDPKPLLVFDSYRANIDGDENDSTVARAFFARLKLLCDEGATVIVLHHNGKNGEYRGSSDIPGSADWMWNVESSNKEKLDSFKLTPIKARGQAKAFDVRFDYGAGEFESIAGETGPADPTLIALLRANVDSGLTRKKLIEMARDEGIGERGVKKFVDEHMDRSPGIRGKGSGAHRKLFWQEGPGQQDFKYRLPVEGDEQS